MKRYDDTGMYHRTELLTEFHLVWNIDTCYFLDIWAYFVKDTCTLYVVYMDKCLIKYMNK